MQLALAVLLACIAVAASGQLLDEVDFQIHSFDDLREWPQIIGKGATYLKIDPHWMPPSFCATQPRVRDPSRGCFVLTHDRPATTSAEAVAANAEASSADPVGAAISKREQQRREAVAARRAAGKESAVGAARSPFNTTDDVLDLIADPRYRDWLTRSDIPVAIALCFKYDNGNPCDGTVQAANWTALIDDFYGQANAIIDKFSLNLQFILDGSGTPTKRDCIAQRWRPWIATWIVSQDPMLAAESNDVNKAYDRFQVNNMPEGVPSDISVNAMRAIGWGKFQKGDLPFLFWEPSDQQAIQTVINAYGKGPRHEPGFRFAINIDPVQFEVYAGSLTGNAWNYALPLPQSGSRPLPAVADVFASAGGAATTVLAIAEFDAGASAVKYQSFSVSEVLGTLTPLFPTAQPLSLPRQVRSDAPLTTWSVARGVLRSGTAQILIAGDDVGSFAVFGLETPTNATALNSIGAAIAAQSFPIAWSRRSLVGRLQATSAEAWDFVTLHAYSQPKCALALQLEGFNFGSFAPTLLGPERCVVASTSQPIDGVSVSAAHVTQGSPYCAAVDGVAGAVVFSAGGGQALMSSVCASMSKGVVSATNPAVIAVGSQPSVSLQAQFAGPTLVSEVTALVAAADSFCFNSHLGNTRNEPAVCDQQPASTPFVLTYTYGALSAFNAHLSSQTPATACADDLFHGMYDMGSAPAVALYASGGVPGLLAVHQGLNNGTADAGGCGLPIARPGQVIVDSWSVPDFIV